MGGIPILSTLSLKPKGVCDSEPKKKKKKSLLQQEYPIPAKILTHLASVAFWSPLSTIKLEKRKVQHLNLLPVTEDIPTDWSAQKLHEMFFTFISKTGGVSQ